MNVRLLVSVRNAAEAQIAVAGGADIIDVKEPQHGSLGFAGTDVLASVIAAVRQQVPVSAALGECSEWLRQQGSEARAAVSLPAGLRYTKLGLAGLLRQGPQWTQHWRRAREAAQSEHEVPHSVAVAYADSDAAESPPPAEVLQVAADHGCSVFLIDTWQKDGRTTFDCLSVSELSSLQQAARDARLTFALAGRLTTQHLPLIRNIQPDIVGVRGAVCSNGNRTSSLCRERMQTFRAALTGPDHSTPQHTSL